MVSLDTFYPRCHPAPLECCGCVADVNPATGKATIYMTSQAPHAHRTLFAIVAGLPEHQIRIVSPDIGGGFGNKVPIYPGYVVATAASLLIGRPVKWIEDRFGNLISTGFARDYHMHGELALKDGRMTGLRASLLSDNGAFFADAQPTRFKAGLFHICTGSYDIPAAHVERRRRIHEQGARRRRLPVLVPGHRGVVPDRAARADGGVRAGRRPGRLPHAELHQAGAVPVHVRDRVRVRLGRLREGARPRAREARLCRAAQGAGGGAGRGPADRDRRRVVHRGRRRGAGQDLRHRRPSHVRLGRAPHPPDRQGDPEAGRRSPRARATRRPTARSSPRSSASRAEHVAGRGGRYRHDAVRPRHLREPLDADQRRRHGDHRAQAARQGPHDRRPSPRGVRGRPRVGERARST